MSIPRTYELTNRVSHAMSAEAVPADEAVNPFADTYAEYRRKGWMSPIPVGLRTKTDPSSGPHKKSGPPTGYTGYTDRIPTPTDLAAWAKKYPDYNIALHLPPVIVVPDVDDHDHDTGESTGLGSGLMAEWVEKYGELPPTYRSTRHPGEHTGGHRFYRLPPGVNSDAMRDLGPGVELLRGGHRYSIVWPSVFGGLTYRWYGPDGLPCEIPEFGAIPTLPMAWCIGLGFDPENPEQKRAGSKVDDRKYQELLAQGGPAVESHDLFRPGYRTRSACAETVAAMRKGYLEDPDGNTALWGYAVALGRLMPHALAEAEVLKALGDAVAVARDAGHLKGCAECRRQIDKGLCEGMADRTLVMEDPAVVVNKQTGEITEVPSGGMPDMCLREETADNGSEADSGCSRVDWYALWELPDGEEWIVEGFIPARRAVALYSAPKLGKSLLMLELAVRVSRGEPLMGMSTTQGRVIYIDHENDPRGDVRSRLQAMCMGPPDLGDLWYYSFPQMASLDTPEGGARLQQIVSSAGGPEMVGLIVIDTVSRTIAGEENSNDTWLAFYRHTGKHLKAAGIAYVRLDHSGKDESKGQRGGSAKSGDVDAIWQLTGSGVDFDLHLDGGRMQFPNDTIGFRRVTSSEGCLSSENRSDLFAGRARKDGQFAAVLETKLGIAKRMVHAMRANPDGMTRTAVIEAGKGNTATARTVFDNLNLHGRFVSEERVDSEGVATGWSYTLYSSFGEIGEEHVTDGDNSAEEKADMEAVIAKRNATIVAERRKQAADAKTAASTPSYSAMDAEIIALVTAAGKGLSSNAIVDNVKGRAGTIRERIIAMVADGRLARSMGGNGGGFLFDIPGRKAAPARPKKKTPARSPKRPE